MNTTSRIEGMSKHLGTRLLVSDAVVEGLQGFSIRSVGRFTLKGKTVPVELFEVDCEITKESDKQSESWQLFSQTLELFQNGAWTEAYQGFENVLKLSPEDGPALLYKNYCDVNNCTPPENWQGVINMEEK